MRLVQGATRGMLARLALPKCKSYHWWHNTRLKGKGLWNKEREKGDKSQEKKTTLQNIMTKANIDASPSKLSMYADERIFSNVANVLRRQHDDGWTKKKLGMCAKSATMR